MKSLHSFTAKTAQGELLDLSSLKNHVVLVVNVASKCGYTKQYKDLQEMYAKLNGKGFTILAFPCNQFGGQEPASCDLIDKETAAKFGRTFTLMDKVDVNGANAAPVFKEFLNPQSKIGWNFEKYLIDKEGQIVKHYGSGAIGAALEKDILAKL